MTRRDWLKVSSGCACALASAQTPADYRLTVGPCTWEVSQRRKISTTAYNGQIPGPLLRFQEGKSVSIDVTNETRGDQVVHWHGLYLPSEMDGAMEEGTPPVAGGATQRYTFTPEPSGFRWYHTHVFAGNDLNKGQYTGQHGFLWIEPRANPGHFDEEFFLALHDWRGQLLASDDGSMNPAYDVSTVNGRVLGFGEPLRVKTGQRVLLNILNSSPTEVHWVALAGHAFQVVALDGNPVTQPSSVSMLRLAPAERVSALVEMNNPGIWELGEVRKHIKAAGMGIVVEYADRSGPPQWDQPDHLDWDYFRFAATLPDESMLENSVEIPLVFESKFTGHGAMDHWTINGRSYPHTELIALTAGKRYRLLLKNHSTEDHPIHLHRHSFEVLRKSANMLAQSIRKDTVLVEAGKDLPVFFKANNPGLTLLHCHQQDHMDAGFMMLFRYA